HSTRFRAAMASSARCGGDAASRCGCAWTQPVPIRSPTTSSSTGYNDGDGRRPAEAPAMPHPTAAAAPLIVARGLAFSRNDLPVFGPLDFSVEAGEAMLVQGGNGAGKTTLLRVLA